MTAILAGGETRAQVWPADPEPSTLPVYQMARPAYQRPGIAAGSFLFLPELAQSLAYDDNIFATDRNRQSDWVSITNAALSFRSQWAQHGVSGRLFSARDVYLDHGSNNGFLWGGDIAGRVNLSGDALLQLDGGFVRQPLARGAIEFDAQAAERPIYDTSTLAISYVQRGGRAFNRVQIAMRDVSYLSDRNAFRNASRITLRDRVGIDLTPAMNVFLEGSYADHDWKRRGALRNYDLLTGLAGIGFELPARLRAELGVGVLRQGFENSAFETLVTPIVSEQIIWNVLPLTTISLAADRTLVGTETFCSGQPAACQSASGGSLPGAAPFANVRNTLETSAAEIGVQHEFWHNILGELRYRYQRDHFDFNGLTDRLHSLNANLRLLVNRYLTADLDYAYRKRDANLPFDRTFNSGPFSENVLTLTLRAGL